MLSIYNSKDPRDIVMYTNGLGVVTTTESVIEETLNGDYILTFKVPSNSKYVDLLVKYNIVRDENYNGFQPFRITKVRREFDYVECICKHLTNDLDKNFIEDTHLDTMQGSAAFNKLLNTLGSPHSFTGSCNLTNTATLYIVRKTFAECFYASNNSNEGTFLDRWNGEIERNGYNLNVVTQRGEDRGFRVQENKNIMSLEESIEGEEITRIMPVGRRTVNNNEVPYLLDEKYIDSPLIGNYPSPSYAILDLAEAKIDDKTTQEQVNKIMRDAVKSQYDDKKVDIPKINFKVDFIETSKLNGYKEKSILNQLYIGDICTIYSNKLKIDVKARLIKYKWDCNLKKYIELELGDYTKAQAGTVAKLENKVNKNTKQSIDYLKEEQQVATNLINNALGGYVVKRPGELLIMDTEDIATATKVWRWNSSGLGYSPTGYNGPYQTAITIDGHIVANFINTGELDANLIKVGSITSKAGDTTINVENGSFNFGNKFVYDGTNMYFTKGAFVVKNDLGDVIASINQNNWMQVQGLYVNGYGECFQNVGPSSRSLILQSTTDTDPINGGNSAQYVSFKGTHPEFNARFVRYNDEGFIRLEGGGLFLQANDNQDGRLEVRAPQNGGKGGHVYIDMCTDAVSDNTNRFIIYQGHSAIEVTGDFSVGGQKHCIQDTESYGRRLINAYETAENYFGDIGEATIINNSITINIDTIFMECINTDYPYQVFTQIYNGSISKIERFKDRFVVTGEPNTEFAWELKGKRRGYETVRLEIGADKQEIVKPERIKKE